MRMPIRVEVHHKSRILAGLLLAIGLALAWMSVTPPDRAFAWQSSLSERAVLFVQRVRRRLVKQFRRITTGIARRMRARLKGGVYPHGDSGGSGGGRA